MKNAFKTIFSFAAIMTLALIMVAPSAEAAPSTIDSRQISGNTTNLSGSVNNSLAQVCLRGPGNAFRYNPSVWLTVNGERLDSQKMAPGECRSFYVGENRANVSVSVSRTPAIGTYYFDLKS